jgi:hypothetical protein
LNIVYIQDGILSVLCRIFVQSMDTASMHVNSNSPLLIYFLIIIFSSCLSFDPPFDGEHRSCIRRIDKIYQMRSSDICLFVHIWDEFEHQILPFAYIWIQFHHRKRPIGHHWMQFHRHKRPFVNSWGTFNRRKWPMQLNEK